MQRRSQTVACLPLHRQSPYGTSYLGVWLCAGEANNVTPLPHCVWCTYLVHCLRMQDLPVKSVSGVLQAAAIFCWNVIVVLTAHSSCTCCTLQRLPVKHVLGILQAAAILFWIIECRRACYGVLRFIMESDAKGCEVIVSGKLRAQRAKAMKFKDGYMIASGHPAVEYIDGCVRHVMLRQGVLGIKASLFTNSTGCAAQTCCNASVVCYSFAFFNFHYPEKC